MTFKRMKETVVVLHMRDIGCVIIMGSRTWDPTIKPNKASYISKCSATMKFIRLSGTSA